MRRRLVIPDQHLQLPLELPSNVTVSRWWWVIFDYYRILAAGLRSVEDWISGGNAFGGGLSSVVGECCILEVVDPLAVVISLQVHLKLLSDLD